MMNKFKSILLIGLASLSLGACGKIVEAGSVGVKISNLGSGVQEVPLQSGWQMTGIGERIVEYPVTQKVYTFSASGQDGTGANEEIIFNDKTGLTMAGDVAVTARVQAAKAPYIFTKYRMSTEELIHGPIRNSIRSAINIQAGKLTAEEIYTGGKSTLIAQALLDVQKEYAKDGIDIINLDWVGAVRYPQSVTAAITLKTTKMQEAEAAKADEARAIAQANAKVAEARGDAEATRIRGEALRTNPQILQQMWIDKWNGDLPTYVGNGQTMMMVNPTR